MHGSLARKLRAFGFDASYYRGGGDEGILEAADRENRIILSSDRALVARAASGPVPAFLLKGKTDGLRLRELSTAAAGLGIALRRGDPLCSLCGDDLQELKRADVVGLVPPSVERRHRLFYRCYSCGHFYWRGSHWKKLRSLADLLGGK
jgi:uncharacterized protein with PIN domain